MYEDSLFDRCSVNTNIEEDTFVGFECKGDRVTISFPLGFRLSEDEKQLRKDILLLINVLSQNTDQHESQVDMSDDFRDVNHPIFAYFYIVNDFLSRGYYKETERINTVGKRGIINWDRTIKRQKHFIQDNEIVYLDFEVRKNNTNDNELITLIHEYCVYESFLKIGWLYTSHIPEKPRLRFNKGQFIDVVVRKLNQTNNDRNRQLFLNMLAVIRSTGDNQQPKDFSYGTKRFEYVWESMIDKAFGVKNKNEYFPKTRWVIEGGKYDNSALEPDTIMISEDSIFVIDAKYYKYGWSKTPRHLPDSSSVNKQITYGEYVYNNTKNRKIYNAFLMPYNCHGGLFNTNDGYHYIGYAESDWKNTSEQEPYQIVAGILVDVKELMKNYSYGDDKVIKLGNLIQEKVDKELKQG